VSGALALLVIVFYVDGSEAATYYSAPAVLWGLVPCLGYWLGRAWLVAWRGNMHADPIVYALRDPISYAVVAAMAGLTTSPCERRTQSMRLLIALQYYLPHRTGYTLHVRRVAEALATRGHAVTVLTARHLPSLPAREQIAGVEVVRLAAPVRISRGAVMPTYLWHAWRLAAAADTIWLSSPLLETALWGMIAKARRKRLVITHHGDLHLPGGLFDRFIEWFTYRNYRIGASLADAIVGYSADYAAHSPYLLPYGDKTTIISPPISMRHRIPRAPQCGAPAWPHKADRSLASPAASSKRSGPICCCARHWHCVTVTPDCGLPLSARAGFPTKTCGSDAVRWSQRLVTTQPFWA